MPMYPHRCEKCDLVVEIVRHFSEYDQPPTPEEVPKARKGSKKAKCEHKWKREIGSSIRAMAGRNWGPGKGHW